MNRAPSPPAHPEVLRAVWSAGFSPLHRREVQRVGEFQVTIAVPTAKRRERRAPSPTTRGCTASLLASPPVGERVAEGRVRGRELFRGILSQPFRRRRE